MLSNLWPRRKAPGSVLGGFALLAGWMAASGQEIEVRNDSLENFGTAYIVGDFSPGEQAGAWLTSPCNGAIKAVRILWLAGDPGAVPTLEENIWVFRPSFFPFPGEVLLQLEGPQMLPGGMNEFRYMDQTQTVPINVPVSAGQTFVVSLEYANQTFVGEGGPSVVRDVDGCQAGRNVLYAIPGGWLGFCIFLQGDLVIRAMVECGQPDPRGACCLPTGDCLDNQSAAQCTGQGGVYRGDGSQCAQVTCPIVTEACCFPDRCEDLTVDDCLLEGGVPQGVGTECATTTCPIPLGACCLYDGGCVDQVSPETCQQMGGVFQEPGLSCASVDCEGACCLDSGGCLPLTGDQCAMITHSSWAGPGSDCTDSNQSGTADACECGLPPEDWDLDCDVDVFDYARWMECATGPVGHTVRPKCDCFDTEGDGDVDLIDWGAFQVAHTGIGPGCP